MRAKKFLDQHFLRDENIMRKEVTVADVCKKRVLEIGAGDGRLTEKILEQNPKKVYAVEKDKELATILKNKFKNDKRIEVIEADFLELKPCSVDVIIGNIPYSITSKIIFKLKEYEFECAVLIVQKEFAEKMVAKPNEKNYGRLSVTAQLAFDIELVQKVPRHLFYPVPKVDSAMIKLKKTNKKITARDEEIIRVLFQHKNQLVKNALRSLHLTVPEKFAKRRVRTLIKEECLEIAQLTKSIL
jgi:16S rRNA (adenine1518-N6/adenine1519-N6)-dimethyltransferase